MIRDDDSYRDQVKSIVAEALGRPPGDRQRFIQEACRDNDTLRREVESLLAGDEQFLEAGSPRGVGVGSPEAPSHVGPYRLLEPIGEGGMGEVYLAEQSEPRRQVALKLIRVGLGTKDYLARFEAERQALALMNHPQIAKVFDAGTTPAGLPFFAMEYVQGRSITRHCDEKRLTVRERIQIFIQVCEGVHHAHQKGIIHRDLKPTNVLVAQEEGASVAKIIDFGVAKAMDQRLTERTLTQLGQVVGTPEYMSPEQAAGSTHDIDTRSDIYSLGVLLYELLVGSLPFALDSCDGGYPELQRVIREVQPPKPSTRVSQVEGARDTARNRRTEPARLAREVRGDLDWITMKALEKDRNRRYATALELGQDLERFLKSEPVSAGPPSRLYRARKFVARNAGLVAVSTLLVLLASSGLGAYVIQLQESRESFDRFLDVALGARRSWADRAKQLDELQVDPDRLTLVLEGRYRYHVAAYQRERALDSLGALAEMNLDRRQAAHFMLWTADEQLREWPADSTSQLGPIQQALDGELDPAGAQYAAGLLAEDLETAIPHFEKAIVGDPLDCRAHEMLCSSLLFSGRHGELRDRVRVAREFYPEHPVFPFLFSLSLALRGEVDQARVNLETGVKSVGETSQHAFAQVLELLIAELVTIEGSYPRRAQRVEALPDLSRLLGDLTHAVGELRIVSASAELQPGWVLPVHPAVLESYGRLARVPALGLARRDTEVQELLSRASDVTDDGFLRFCLALSNSDPPLPPTVGLYQKAVGSPATWMGSRYRSITYGLYVINNLYGDHQDSLTLPLLELAEEATKVDHYDLVFHRSVFDIARRPLREYPNLTLDLRKRIEFVLHHIVRTMERESPDDYHTFYRRMVLEFTLGDYGEALDLGAEYLKRYPERKADGDRYLGWTKGRIEGLYKRIAK